MKHPSHTIQVCFQEQSQVSHKIFNFLSELYTDEELKVDLDPLAKWCNANYIEKRVIKIVANENKIILSDNSVVDYDILALNLGSKTKGTTGKHTIEGVWEYSLTTRPINDLLPKIIVKENKLKADGIIPDVVIVGGGAAGTELAFAFKARWTQFFGHDIKV